MRQRFVVGHQDQRGSGLRIHGEHQVDDLRAVADQYLLFRNGMADLDPGLGTVLWRCVTDSASEG